MSGHSKWANIKHRKAAVDAKRGKIFTKLIRELTVAARHGGPDPESNTRLRSAIAMAKSNNMPNDTIDRAINRGSGKGGIDELHELYYEGYGPGGSAVYLHVMTDNKNRTVSEIRKIFTKHGGSLGESGCVAWMFEKKGRIAFDINSVDEDKIFEIAIEAGAEDVTTQESELIVVTASDDFESVKAEMDRQGLKHLSAEVTMAPKNNIKVEGKEAEQMLRLMEAFDDSDDVQDIFSNFDIPDEIMEAMG